jgi:hypothetical protein
MGLSYRSAMYGKTLDLSDRTLDSWPSFDEWPAVVELLEATILNEGPYPRAEQHLTNDALTCISALASSRFYVLAADEQMRRFGDDLEKMERSESPPRFAGLSLGGRYWARTSEPQLVESANQLVVTRHVWTPAHLTTFRLFGVSPRGPCFDKSC